MMELNSKFLKYVDDEGQEKAEMIEIYKHVSIIPDLWEL